MSDYTARTAHGIMASAPMLMAEMRLRRGWDEAETMDETRLR